MSAFVPETGPPGPTGHTGATGTTGPTGATGTGGFLARTVYTSGAATHNFNASATTAIITVVGAGGGGGGHSGSSTLGGAGGGGGGAWTNTKIAVPAGLTGAYSIGAGGAGGSGGTGARAGATGGNTTFEAAGTTYTAGGGSGGGSTNVGGGTGSPAPGGVSTNGDIKVAGEAGGLSSPFTVVSGNFSTSYGGASVYGQGAPPKNITTSSAGVTGAAGSTYGGGGGGGGGATGGPGPSGGVGASGMVMVEEFGPVTVALTMIVKDEERNLVRCLDAARPLIDSLVLIDTGSTDATPRIAREWAKANGVLLRWRVEPWVNFKVNRTNLFRFAEGAADWFLLLDSDMVVHAPDVIRDLDAVDSWHGRVKFRGLDYSLPMLVRASKPWYYEGVAHSYLACSESFDEAELPGLWVEDYSSTGPEKLKRDLRLLSVEHAANPLDARTAFYLAQTYYDLDMFPEAIQTYRTRAYMDGWDEETYYARYRLGCLLVEHVSFAQGAKELLRAWELRPGRAEALRALSGAAGNVADKIPPTSDRLFVHAGAYVKPVGVPCQVCGKEALITSTYCTNHLPATGITADKVSAVIVTRGNVDLQPILDTLPYEDVVIWDNSKARDFKIYGRYAALEFIKNDVVYYQDDDIIFTAHDELLAAYDPGRIVANMDAPWVEACGYTDMVLMGAGSILDKTIPPEVFDRYLAEHPFDDEFLLECDFVLGTMAHWRRIDLGYEVRPFADDPDRLYRQPWQAEAKQRVRDKARALVGASS